MNFAGLQLVFAPSVIVKIRSTRLFDDFRRDIDVVTAGVTIDFGDSLGVGLHHRTRQRAACLGLYLRGELLVLDPLVALKGNATDHRVFDHDHYQPVARALDLHVLEQAGLDQRLEAVVDLSLVETTTLAPLEIRADGLDFDALVTLDLD